MAKDNLTQPIGEDRMINSDGTAKSDYQYLGSRISKYNSSYFKDVMQRNGLYKKDDVKIYDELYRFGKFDPSNALQNTREFLFFTKPDLHLVEGKSLTLNPELANEPIFVELRDKYSHLIPELQKSADSKNNPLSLFLSNCVTNTLDIPGLSGTTIDTPVNIYGTSYEYRGSSEASDDNHTFSLEFEDTRYLDVYMYFKAYEEYQTLKRHGRITPPDIQKYVVNKVLHDQIGIYKFLVDQDTETIVYYAYLTGVMFTSLPRDTYSNNDFSDGARYSVDMKAAFVEDMNPLILADFNYLTQKFRSSHTSTTISMYNSNTGIINEDAFYKPAKSAYITTHKESNGRKRYKLKWRR